MAVLNTRFNTDLLTMPGLPAQFEAAQDFNVLIMSPVAAVVGANYLVHLERQWTLARASKATDQVYRIGQTKPANIHLPAVLHPEYDAFDVDLDRLLRGKPILKGAVVTPETVSTSDVLKSMGF